MDNMRDMLGSADWGVSDYSIFYNAGAIWGAIGPQRFFGPGSVYESLLWCFLVGVILPFVPWLCHRVWPSPTWHLVNIPLLASCIGPGRIQNFILVGFGLSWLFQNYLFRHYHGWWTKYNYILAIGLDCGVAFAGLGVTLLQQAGQSFPTWMLNPEDREATCR
jgi:hypothetical protein